MSVYLDAQRLLTIRCTLRKMLQRRGYTVPRSVCEETLEDVEARYLQHMQSAEGGSEADMNQFAFYAQRPSVEGSTETIAVFFPNITIPTNLGIGPIRHYVSVMKGEECKVGIFVVCGGLTSPAVSQLRELENQQVYITAFNENELLVDIYEHEKVPRHELLTPGEKDELLIRLKITPRQLPEMQRHDPMARYLGLRVGDVVRIRRVSATAAFEWYYRIVVNSEDFD